ncbi:MAG: glycosyltransferase [Planctomycetota bacterium]
MSGQNPPIDLTPAREAGIDHADYRVVVPSKHTTRAYVTAREFLVELSRVTGSATTALDRLPMHVLSKAIKRTGVLQRLGPMRSAWRQGRYDVVFVPEDQLGFFPPMGLRRRVVPWCMDSWPKFDAGLHAFFKKFGVQRACFTQRAAAARCQEALPDIDACWMPESTPPGLYDAATPLADRSIRLISYGRQLDGVNEAMAALGDATSGVFDATACRQRFADMTDLRRALGQTRATIAYPRSTTDPTFSGGSETMTLRYLEAVASGTVLLGQAPREMIDLFGFDPVVPATPDTLRSVVQDLDDRPERYQAHADRCHARFLQVGTSAVRARQFADWLRTGAVPFSQGSSRTLAA